jgi:hypothetical protein
MFQLTWREAKSSLLQIARAKGRGGRRTELYAYTEQGVAMLSSVLKRTGRAGERPDHAGFVRVREVLAGQETFSGSGAAAP